MIAEKLSEAYNPFKSFTSLQFCLYHTWKEDKNTVQTQTELTDYCTCCVYSGDIYPAETICSLLRQSFLLKHVLFGFIHTATTPWINHFHTISCILMPANRHAFALQATRAWFNVSPAVTEMEILMVSTAMAVSPSFLMWENTTLSTLSQNGLFIILKKNFQTQVSHFYGFILLALPLHGGKTN